jgi:hypothetical protein
LLQTLSSAEKHQLRANVPVPPRATAPVTATGLPRLLLQHSDTHVLVRLKLSHTVWAHADGISRLLQYMSPPYPTSSTAAKQRPTTQVDQTELQVVRVVGWHDVSDIYI